MKNSKSIIVLASTLLLLNLAGCKQDTPRKQATAVTKNIPSDIDKHDNEEVDAIIHAKIKTNLKQTLGIPTTDKIIVNTSPISGLYEVIIGKQILYSNNDVSYVIMGDMLDTRNQVNLTQDKIQKLETIVWQDLPLNNALLFTKGSAIEHRQIAIFSDPNCGYCKKMEHELQKINNIKVYNFLMPILGQDSVEKAKNIWCNNKDANNKPINPIIAWHSLMLDDKEPNKLNEQELSSCINPIKDNIELGHKLGINGTPAIFFIDGSKISGFISAVEMEKKFASLK